MKISTRPSLIIVEGEQEAEFVKELKDRNLCGRESIVRHPDGLNGNNSFGNLARIIETVIRSTKFDRGPVIVLFDREKSKFSVEQIKVELNRELKRIEHIEVNNYDFIIGVSDRSIESWIIPYVDKNGEFPVVPEMKDEREGKLCKNELTSRLKVRNIPYDKTTVGVELLHAINPDEFSNISNSFNLFYKELNKYYNSVNNINCKWLNKKN